MKFKLLVMTVCFFVLILPLIYAEEMKYIYHPPESADDIRYNYHWELLNMALEKTKETYGSYVMKPSQDIMNENRQKDALKKGINLTIMVFDAGQELESMFTPVRIPLDKGLLGYRVFLIKKSDQPRFSSIKTLDELKQLSVGQGMSWPDVQIWKANGFRVVTGDNYEGLFEMLLRKRFDFFSRGIVEVIGEYAQRKTQMPDLAIEETILLYYPAPFYFFFQKSEQGKRLADRVEKGLLKTFEDKASFTPLFMKYHGDAIKRHNLKNRKIFHLNNPLLTPETPLKDKRLWFDPTQE
ncbi:MAG: hypothetical protein HQK79_19025 [Desulfobacterales bacterium]|nr:hypothetical protein [Desulfobacterales bacterium]